MEVNSSFDACHSNHKAFKFSISLLSSANSSSVSFERIVTLVFDEHVVRLFQLISLQVPLFD